MAVLPTDYTDASTPTGATTELPATTTRGVNAINTQINTNTTAIAGKGDASTNTATSVDSEVALFSGTGGKTLKRATGSGIAKLTSGVLGTAAAGTDYIGWVAPSTAGYILGTSDGTTWTSQPLTRVNSTASSATPAINTDTTDQFNITALAAAITSMTSGLTGTPRDGQHLMIRIKDNGTARAITWGASFASSGVATLLATTVVSKTHLIGLIYDSVKSAWVCVAVDATGY